MLKAEIEKLRLPAVGTPTHSLCVLELDFRERSAAAAYCNTRAKLESGPRLSIPSARCSRSVQQTWCGTRLGSFLPASSRAGQLSFAGAVRRSTEEQGSRSSTSGGRGRHGAPPPATTAARRRACSAGEPPWRAGRSRRAPLPQSHAGEGGGPRRGGWWPAAACRLPAEGAGRPPRALEAGQIWPSSRRPAMARPELAQRSSSRPSPSPPKEEREGTTTAA